MRPRGLLRRRPALPSLVTPDIGPENDNDNAYAMLVTVDPPEDNIVAARMAVRAVWAMLSSVPARCHLATDTDIAPASSSALLKVASWELSKK